MKKKSLEDEFLDALSDHKCDHCGEYKPEVQYVANLYDEDINAITNMEWICDECYHECLMDI